MKQSYVTSWWDYYCSLAYCSLPHWSPVLDGADILTYLFARIPSPAYLKHLYCLPPARYILTCVCVCVCWSETVVIGLIRLCHGCLSKPYLCWISTYLWFFFQWKLCVFLVTKLSWRDAYMLPTTPQFYRGIDHDSMIGVSLNCMLRRERFQILVLPMFSYHKLACACPTL